MTDRFWQAIRAGDREAVAQWWASNPGPRGVRADNGHSAVRMACDCGHPDLARWLLDQDAEADPFDLAALGETERLASAVEERPALLQGHSHDGMSLLHLAAFFGHAALVDWLLERGAPVSIRSENPMNNTPLHAAIAGVAGEQIAPRLLAAGADPSAVGGAGVTPLHLAASRGSQDLVERLRRAGAPLTAMEDGRRPADLARGRGFNDLAGKLESDGIG